MKLCWRKACFLSGRKQIYLLVALLLFCVVGCFHQQSRKSDLLSVDDSKEDLFVTVSDNLDSDNQVYKAQLDGNFDKLWKYVRYLGKKVPECMNASNRDVFIWINNEYEFIQGSPGIPYFQNATKENAVCTAIACEINQILPYNVKKNKDSVELFFGSNYRLIEDPIAGDYGYRYDFDDYFVQIFFDTNGLLSREYECIIQITGSDLIDIGKLNRTKQNWDCDLNDEVLEEAKWEPIREEIRHIDEYGLLFINDNIEEWKLRFKKNKLNEVYFKNKETNCLAEMDAIHKLLKVCVPNHVLFDMKGETMSMEALTKYWNVPYEWSLYYPLKEEFLWQSDVDFDTLEEWNPYDKSFYCFYFNDVIVSVTADKNGVIYANDYTEIKRYPDINF